MNKQSFEHPYTKHILSLYRSHSWLKMHSMAARLFSLLFALFVLLYFHWLINKGWDRDSLPPRALVWLTGAPSIRSATLLFGVSSCFDLFRLTVRVTVPLPAHILLLFLCLKAVLTDKPSPGYVNKDLSSLREITLFHFHRAATTLPPKRRWLFSHFKPLKRKT